LISAPGAQQTAGRAVSLLGVLRLRGLTCPAAPAGVEHLPLQSTSLSAVFFSKTYKKQQSFRKEPFKKRLTHWVSLSSYIEYH
jgi:hypothetical protein